MQLACAFATAACRRPILTAQPPPSPEQIAELWAEPEPGRDLFGGIGGQDLAPDPTEVYTVISVKSGGFSRGYTVKDPTGREWSVKLPPEASTEVVASRIHWAIGYHQPPIYYLARWNAEQAQYPNPQLPARFREQKPKFHGLNAHGNWSYYKSPFNGTRELAGLLVLEAMLGNSDLKDEQNFVYTLSEPIEHAARWYVARDLGQSFGRTGRFSPPRGDPAVFEQTPFIKGVVNGIVKFDYHGRHGVLFDHIVPADVRWICERLQKLIDRQWADAFRAGGYTPDVANRFIGRMHQKIAEGLALKD